jgi:NAD(P)-dependent dehydrogenase (short-subunit alcohol dehydrogenase family)
MLTLKLARALEPEEFTVVALHPGMVDTGAAVEGHEYISVSESVGKS